MNTYYETITMKPADLILNTYNDFGAEDSCNKSKNLINKQTNENQHHIINQLNSNSIRW